MKPYVAQYAGSWYPETKKELKALLDKYFQKASIPSSIKNVCGIIVPHAGIQYSGQTAAYGFKTIKDIDFDTAVILAPTHKTALSAISTVSFSSVITPLGELEIDMQTTKRLNSRHEIFQDRPESYIGEHSYEIELPFLQAVAEGKQYKILPLIIGDLNLDDFKIASQILNEELEGKKPIFIASSDFTHYGMQFGYLPFSTDVPERLYELDGKAIELICKNKAEDFQNYIYKTGATICGKNPITFLITSLKNKKGKLLKYTTSGELTGDYSHSVSYASIVFV